jgi:hypothetical protein
MRIGSALDALDHVAAEMPTLERSQRLGAYAAMQAVTERLRSISKAKGLSVSIINAQLLKIQFSAEALAGLGGARAGDEQQLADIRHALSVLAGPDCFGYQIDAIE